MDYTFTRDGVDEKVTLERWIWGVMYKDGTELHQFDAFGKFHQFKEINVPEVKTFVMYRSDNMAVRIDMPVREGMQFFHFYRIMMLKELVGNGGEMTSSRKVKVYVFGWKRDGVASYNYILPDDRLLTADHDVPALIEYGV